MNIEPEIKKKVISSLSVLSYKRKINIKGLSFTLYKTNNKFSLESPILRTSIKHTAPTLKESLSVLCYIPSKVLYDLSFLNKLIHSMNVRTTYCISNNADILSYSTKIVFFANNNKNKLYHMKDDMYFDYKNNFFDKDELVYDMLNSLYNIDLQPRIPINEETIKLLEILIL